MPHTHRKLDSGSKWVTQNKNHTKTNVFLAISWSLPTFSIIRYSFYTLRPWRRSVEPQPSETCSKTSMEEQQEQMDGNQVPKMDWGRHKYWVLGEGKRSMCNLGLCHVWCTTPYHTHNQGWQWYSWTGGEAERGREGERGTVGVPWMKSRVGSLFYGFFQLQLYQHLYMANTTLVQPEWLNDDKERIQRKPTTRKQCPTLHEVHSNGDFMPTHLCKTWGKECENREWHEERGKPEEGKETDIEYRWKDGKRTLLENKEKEMKNKYKARWRMIKLKLKFQ